MFIRLIMLAKLCCSDQLYILASTRRIARLQSFPGRIAAVNQSCHRLYQSADLRRLRHRADDELLSNICRWNLGAACLQIFNHLMKNELNHKNLLKFLWWLKENDMKYEFWNYDVVFNDIYYAFNAEAIKMLKTTSRMKWISENRIRIMKWKIVIH